MTLFSTSMILRDPIVLVEFLAIICTLCYLAKLTFSTSLEYPGQGYNAKQNTERTTSPRSFQHTLWSFFTVGTLISTPKRSLLKQKIIR